MILAARMVRISTACARSATTQSEEFRLKDADRFRRDVSSVVAVYDGSLLEWAPDPTLPMETDYQQTRITPPWRNATPANTPLFPYINECRGAHRLFCDDTLRLLCIGRRRSLPAIAQVAQCALVLSTLGQLTTDAPVERGNLKFAL
jgi:hypothetical protein